MKNTGFISSILSVLAVNVVASQSILAQLVIPAADETGTTVQQQGNQFNITGGQLSGDGANLFHSLQQLGLSADQIANFLSNPNIRNILTRVVGGDPSVINGLIQVTGGHSNLFIMNPAGVIFGADARLNVPADFVVTTATGIGFGNNTWFDAVGGNDYGNLMGDPSQFAFDVPQSGSIVNSGVLKVNEGHQLSLIGGNVVNTGTLEAPEGNITVSAIPGTSLLRISTANNLVSLVVDVPRDQENRPLAIKPVDLATLLTIGENDLTLSHNLPQFQGNTVIAGNIDVSSASDGGNITVVGENVTVTNAEIKADGVNNGGTIRIGGDLGGNEVIPNANTTNIDQTSVIHANSLEKGQGGRIIIWSDDTTRFDGFIRAEGGLIGGDGGFVEVSGRNNLLALDILSQVDISASNGQGGTLLLDPLNIVIFPGSALPINQSPTNGIILFSGSIGDFLTTKGNLVIETTQVGSAQGNILQLSTAAINWNSDHSLTLNADNNLTLNGGVFATGKGSLNLNAGSLIAINNNPIQTNQGNITVAGNTITNNQPIITTDGNINLTANTNNLEVNSLIESTGIGSVSLSAGNVVSINNPIITRNGNIDAMGNIVKVNDFLNTQDGNINLTAKTNNLEVNSPVTSTGKGSVDLVSANIVMINSPVITNEGNITLTTDSDNNQEGGIIINGLISTQGGDFIANASTIDASKNGILINYDTLKTDTGNLILNGNILATNSLILKSLGNTTLNGSLVVEGNLETDAGGITVIRGNVTTQGNQTYNNSVSLNQDATLTGNQLNLNKQPLQGNNRSLTLTFNNPVTLSDSIFSNLNNLTSNSPTVITGNVTTQGNQNYQKNVTLLNPIILNANNISFINTVNGNQPLTINVNQGDITFLGEVGNLEALGNVVINSGGITQFNQRINANSITTNQAGMTQINHNITTNGEQNYNDAVMINNDIKLSTNDSNVTFNNNLNATNQTLNKLTIDIGLGNLSFNESVGNNQPLDTLFVNSNSINADNINVFNINFSTQNNINTANLNSQQLILNSQNGQIRTGSINSTNQVNIIAKEGIEINQINAQGSINLTSDSFVRILQGFTNPNNIEASIFTNFNTSEPFNIIITHGEPIFEVGSSNFINSGTAHAITNNQDIIATGTTLTDTTTVGKIAIIFTNPSLLNPPIVTPPIEPNPPIVTPPVEPEPPIVTPPVEPEPPIVTPPVEPEPPIVTPPVEPEPPIVTPPVEPESPIVTPPVEPEPPIVTPPVEPEPPIVTPPVEPNPPIVTPPIEPNPPIVTPPIEFEPEPEPPIDIIRDVLLPVNSGQNSISSSSSLASSGNDNLQSAGTSISFAETEGTFSQDFENFLGISAVTPITAEESQSILQNITEETGVRSALIYAVFRPSTSPQNLWTYDSAGRHTVQEVTPMQEQLELMLVTADGTIIRKRVENVNKEQVLKIAQEFQTFILNPRRPTAYLPASQQLYRWLIAPLESDLKQQKINNLVFILDSGLRSLPLAALHDGKQFLVENYSMAVMPSLSLTDFRYRDLRGQQVLAMGASQFDEQNPLPAVPIELSIIADQLWTGKTFLNDGFTIDNLQIARKEQNYRILHLATHAKFQKGELGNSYIQLWNDKLQLNELRGLGLNDPAIDLMVLSACQTALGDKNSELGFAGAAVLANVKSVLGSLWEVSDEGTLGLMTLFYQSLQKFPTKSQALQEAQLSLLREEVTLEKGQLIVNNQPFELPSVFANVEERNFTHPYYWSAFTLIGNPW